MIREKIRSFTEDICDHNGYTNEVKDEIEYTLSIFLFEIIKIFIVVLLFSLLGLFKEISLVMIVMGLTKPFTGGYHESTQIKCLVATIILSGIIIILSINNNLNFISIILLNLINIFSVYHQAPIINEDMPLTREDLIRKNRIIATISCTTFFIIALILSSKGIYSSIITWTLVIDSCLMFNKKYKIKTKGDL